MKLTWLGHSCFLVEEGGYRILLDPYAGVPGYPPLGETFGAKKGQIPVHRVLCSHQHGDHNAVEQTALLPVMPCPFTIETVETYHDGEKGALRGSNTIHILTAGKTRIAHLGDLGHQLSAEQVKAIGPLDAVLVPVGGFYTIGADEAKAVCDALNPRRVIPMHYRFGTAGYQEIGELGPFLALYDGAAVQTGNSIELDGTPEGIVVLQYQAGLAV
ncbi:MAG: MBL fold metallo-hydrolase [Oscillibacter sp.]|jgi:L-ascorbate metabolism protein UlaG (beta-lactamase superfamily)|nr:MBL fold metallo-hydrolase [Oscillibacter sp.]